MVNAEMGIGPNIQSSPLHAHAYPKKNTQLL